MLALFQPHVYGARMVSLEKPDASEPPQAVSSGKEERFKITCAQCGREGYERTFHDEPSNESWASLPAGWWIDLVDIVVVCGAICRDKWLIERAEIANG